VTTWFHFLPDDGRLQFGRRRRVEVGTTLTIKSRPVLCERGFHASARAFDALRYAPGSLVCRVRLGGEIVVDDDKVCAQQRTVVWMADATRTLHEFACWAAEGALDAIASRGETVDPRSRRAIEVKRLWLDGQATDEELAAARDAAGAAARDAARAAAWAAAWDAAWDAAWVAARDAAWDAALDDMNAELERRLLALAPAGVSA
jgi:hypothetical protein